MKEEAAKRSAGRDAADDTDKRKWMSTAQLWVDSNADPVPVRFPIHSFIHALQ
jgi:Holliday junction resolvase-like predicted endonuclease